MKDYGQMNFHLRIIFGLNKFGLSMVLGTYREVDKLFYLTRPYTTHTHVHTHPIHIHTQGVGEKKKRKKEKLSLN